jgi:hypothetical protein
MPSVSLASLRSARLGIADLESFTALYCLPNRDGIQIAKLSSRENNIDLCAGRHPARHRARLTPRSTCPLLVFGPRRPSSRRPGSGHRADSRGNPLRDGQAHPLADDQRGDWRGSWHRRWCHVYTEQFHQRSTTSYEYSRSDPRKVKRHSGYRRCPDQRRDSAQALHPRSPSPPEVLLQDRPSPCAPLQSWEFSVSERPWPRP